MLNAGDRIGFRSTAERAHRPASPFSVLLDPTRTLERNHDSPEYKWGFSCFTAQTAGTVPSLSFQNDFHPSPRLHLYISFCVGRALECVSCETVQVKRWRWGRFGDLLRRKKTENQTAINKGCRTQFTNLSRQQFERLLPDVYSLIQMWLLLW